MMMMMKEEGKEMFYSGANRTKSLVTTYSSRCLLLLLVRPLYIEFQLYQHNNSLVARLLSTQVWRKVGALWVEQLE